MRVLITGAQGQLGQALQASRPSGISLMALGRAQLDLADAKACRDRIASERPDWLINAGAYTAVDRAEQEPELAYAINAEAPAAFAEALARQGGTMLQISTDFVFSGRQGNPYAPDQPVDPLGVYGHSKAAGETAVLQALSDTAAGYVLRTSWLYSAGGQNFLHTMLRLHRQRHEQGQPLAVVADQVGCPTACVSLAAAIWQLLTRIELARAGELAMPAPIQHWSDAGAASWFDFAVAIGEIGVQLGLLEAAAEVQAIPSTAYRTPAQRPSYSLLNCFPTQALLEQRPLPWRQQLQQVMQLLV